MPNFDVNLKIRPNYFLKRKEKMPYPYLPLTLIRSAITLNLKKLFTNFCIKMLNISSKNFLKVSRFRDYIHTLYIY